jgi:hypothetical protein
MRHFDTAKRLYEICKKIAMSMGEKWPVDKFPGIETHFQTHSPDEVQKVNDVYTYIFSKEGTKIYVDTIENDYYRTGKEPEPHEKELFEKIVNRDVLYTRIVVNDVLYIVSVAKYTTSDFIVICFCKV